MLHVGDRVTVRERPWRVTRAEPVAPGQIVAGLEALDDDAPRTCTVVSPPDDIVQLDPEGPRLHPQAFDSIQAWLDAHRLLGLTTVRDDGLVTGARWGRVQLSGFQLEPTLALLTRPRPSLLVADDVGLGKTIEAGLAMLELLARRRVRRILIVTPAGLVAQWQAELLDKFNLEFRVIADAADLSDAQTALPAGLSPWDAYPRVLTSIDYLKKQTVQRRALAQRWDLVVVDEAHALAESGTTRNPYATQRTRLGRELRDHSKGMLLLTATPHNGHVHSFRSLVALVDPAHATFAGEPEDVRRRVDHAMVRRMKAQITTRDAQGRVVRKFPVRHVRGLPVRSDVADYRSVLAKVSAYCSKTAREAGDSEDAELVGFAMQIVKKRALSSRRALERTVASRLDALKKEKAREEAPERGEIRELRSDLPLPEAQAERLAQRVLRSAVPQDEKRRKSEVRKLTDVARLLASLPAGDPKIAALIAELRAVLAADPAEKVIVFTEYLDTLESLQEAFEAAPELKGRWVVLRGGLGSRIRTARQEEFERDDVRVLLATDAASEGLNLQRRCRRVIHFELPWNPNRLEQRNGRVDRYGQTREPEIRYLFHPESPEEDVLHRLIEKIEAMVASRVSTPDILGVVAGLQELEAGLVDLDAEADDVAMRATRLVRIFEDRTHEFERDVQPILGAAMAGSITTEELPERLRDAGPLLADDLQLEAIAMRALGAAAVKVVGTGIFRIEVPLRWRGPGVAQVYPRATFRRSVAVASARDVEFITPMHSLARALAEDAHRRLLQAFADAPGLPARRCAVRAAPPGAAPGVAFTFLGSIQGGDGLVEEPLHVVRMTLAGNVLPDDGGVDVMADVTAGTTPPIAKVVEAITPAFDELLAKATAEARLRLRARTEALRAQRATLSRTLREEVKRDLNDRLREIELDARRRRGELEADTGQARLFPSDGDVQRRGPETALRAARQVAEERERDLEVYARIDEPAPPRPLGVLVFAPEGWLS